MVGYAFMGAAHSQAWRTVGRVFDLPLDAADGRPLRTRRRRRSRPPRPGSAGTSVETDWKACCQRDDVAAGRHLHAGRQPRRDRHRRAGRRQARAVREAAGQHGGRGAGDGGSAARAARAAGVRSMVGFNYRRVPAVALARAAASRPAGSARSGTSARSTCRTGSSTRSSRWSGGCGRRRPAAARSATSARTSSTSPSSSPASGSPGSTRCWRRSSRSGRCRSASSRAVRDRGGRRARRRSPSTTPRCSSAGSTAARWPRTRRPGSPPAGRTRSGSRSTARPARLAFDLERLNELEFYDGTGDAADAGLPPDPGDRADHPYLAALVAAGAHARLGGHVHPRDRDLVEAVGTGTDPLPSFEDGLQVQLVLDAVQRSAADRGCWTEVEEP